MQGENALCHLLQDPQVVTVSGGEPVCSRHDATKHYKENHSDVVHTTIWPRGLTRPIISQHVRTHRPSEVGLCIKMKTWI